MTFDLVCAVVWHKLYFNLQTQGLEIKKLNQYTMDEKTFRRVATGYMVTNAIARSAASELAEINRKEALEIAKITSFYSHYMTEKQLADRIGSYLLTHNLTLAFEFLNKSLRAEIVHDCQNQKEFTTHLSELIEMRKDKYRPFYQKIEMQMPSDLEELTAEQICSIMSVNLMTPADLKKYHSEKKAKEQAEDISEAVGLFFRAIIIIGCLILIFIKLCS